MYAIFKIKLRKQSVLIIAGRVEGSYDRDIRSVSGNKNHANI
jgi:hypothetical protein